MNFGDIDNMKKVFWTLCYDNNRVRTVEINNNTGLRILKIGNKIKYNQPYF